MTAPAAPPREVPTYDEFVFRPKSADYCVCIFVLNENGKLHKQLEKMRDLPGVDIVIADGGSNDGSTAAEVLQQFGVNTLLVKTGPGKLGASDADGVFLGARAWLPRRHLDRRQQQRRAGRDSKFCEGARRRLRSRARIAIHPRGHLRKSAV